VKDSQVVPGRRREVETSVARTKLKAAELQPMRLWESRCFLLEVDEVRLTGKKWWVGGLWMA
jgi:hypothetical protein